MESADLVEDLLGSELLMQPVGERLDECPVLVDEQVRDSVHSSVRDDLDNWGECLVHAVGLCDAGAREQLVPFGFKDVKLFLRAALRLEPPQRRDDRVAAKPLDEIDARPRLDAHQECGPCVCGAHDGRRERLQDEHSG